jgi:4-hydroxy-tetrahydrodipicolinate synthase
MTSPLKLQGTGTALITPFQPDGSVDERAYRALVKRQLKAGIRMLVPCGTTGEGATLDEKEKELLVRIAVEEADGSAWVVAGSGSNDTRVAVETARRVREWGADAALSLAPPYNKPPQDALVEHFRRVATEAEIPVVVYNVPGRVGCNLTAETTLELAEVPGIAAVKEASGNMSQVMEILRCRPEGFSVLSGEDALTFAMILMGAQGVISVVGNEAPGPFCEMVEAALAGDARRGREIHFELLPLMEANFCESNPIPVKWVMSRLGFCENILRPPLRPLAKGKESLLEQLVSGAEAEGSMS